MWGLKKNEIQPFSLPYVEITGKENGPVVLITAGMDGDEYAGIEAAYQLIEKYKFKQFPGILRIIPIVNVVGFEAGVSWNPVDKKFPKHIFPGHKTGTSSEQLMYQVWQRYGDKVTLWLDLHGGARNEKLTPYILGFHTQQESINKQTKKILRTLQHNTMLIHSWDKVNRIAEEHCTYLMFEAGDQGTTDSAMVELHTKWVTKILETLQSKKEALHTPLKYFQKEYLHVAPCDGIFVPEALSDTILNNVIFGALYTLSRKKITDVQTRHDGHILYQRVFSWVRKGEDLLSLASQFSVE